MAEIQTKNNTETQTQKTTLPITAERNIRIFGRAVLVIGLILIFLSPILFVLFDWPVSSIAGGIVLGLGILSILVAQWLLWSIKVTIDEPTGHITVSTPLFFWFLREKTVIQRDEIQNIWVDLSYGVGFTELQDYVWNRLQLMVQLSSGETVKLLDLSYKNADQVHEAVGRILDYAPKGSVGAVVEAPLMGQSAPSQTQSTYEVIPDMYCTECGEQNPDNSNFCKKCGVALTQAVTTQQTQVLKHPNVIRAVHQKRTSGLALASLILGIIGIFISPLCVLAIIFGGIAIHQTSNDPSLGGRGMAIAGLVMGIVFFLLWTVFWAIFVPVIVSGSA